MISGLVRYVCRRVGLVRNNVVMYIYADPTICDCLYIGMTQAVPQLHPRNGVQSDDFGRS